MSNGGLRQYQTDCLAAIRDTVRGGVKRLVVQAPTGAGKTRLASALVVAAQEKGNRMAFVVPAISLIDQTVEAFYADGIRGIGVIQANHQMTDWAQPVQVCSIQTIRARKAYPEAQAVIIDEVHQLHDTHKNWLTDSAWATVPFIGLSATPWTKGLGKYFHSLLIAAETSDLIKQGYLSPFRVFATGHPDLSKVHIVAGDYHEGELSDAMQQGNLTADIVKTWQEKWGKDKTLCFGVDCAHAKNIQERFEYAGIACGYQDAKTPSDERREIKRKFHNGEFKIVSNVGTLTVGIDWDVRCLILARPTRSEILYTQIIGRALRTANGKDAAIILDHSDTTERLGFVTDIYHDQLNDGQPKPKVEIKPKAKLPKECSACAFLKPPKTPICPNCGFEDKKLNAIIERDGELFELTAKAKRQKREKKTFTTAERMFFFQELKAYAQMHSYKEGWASMKYKERFGTWPPNDWRHVNPIEVTPTTASWIRSRNIAWAKSKRRAELHVE